MKPGELAGGEYNLSVVTVNAKVLEFCAQRDERAVRKAPRGEHLGPSPLLAGCQEALVFTRRGHSWKDAERKHWLQASLAFDSQALS